MFFILMLLWMLLNSHFTWDVGLLQIVLFGIVISALLCVFVFKFTKWDWYFECFFWKNLGRFILFFIILVYEILLSNVKVAWTILRNKSPNPAIVSFDIPIKNEMLRALLANSITLTPGTITIACTETHYVVHCLDEQYIDGFTDSALVKLAKKMDESQNERKAK